MFNLADTITAICTAPGAGAIAAVRISGKDSWDIVKKIFVKMSECHSEPKAKNLTTPGDSSVVSLLQNDNLQHMQAMHGYIKDNEKTIDEVIILPFKSPKSFTTEDTIEIFCHGGNKITSMILDLCLKNGARRASSGEFTFRAFVNGRIDLTEAEAINEIINANTTRAVYAASEILTGSLKEKVKNFRERLFNLITSLESSIEFPMDVLPTNKDEFVTELKKINNDLHKLIKTSEDGQILNTGFKVSIIGAPNVGKSSLLNQLLENQRAIVTSEPGTTRDTIEEQVIIEGYPVILVDTAGIREHKSLSEPEKLGIDRSKFALKNSDLALVVFDLTKAEDAKQIFESINGKPKIMVGNKVDLISNGSSQVKNCDVAISAKCGTNIDELKRLIVKKIKLSFSTQSLIPETQSCHINQRQKELLTQCSSAMNFAIEISDKNAPEDIIADELKKTISKLDEISGKKINEDVISNIFAKFCIGK